jgi:predicted DNA-binding transcriptional regulator AlpA
MDTDKDAFAIDEFCKRHSISRSYLYILWSRGDGPRFMQIGARRLISREAARDWRQASEKAARAE